MLESVISQIKNNKAVQTLESKYKKTKEAVVEQTSVEANKALSWVVGKLVDDQIASENKDEVKAEVKADLVSQIKSFDPKALPSMLSSTRISLDQIKDVKNLRGKFGKKLVEKAESKLASKTTEATEQTN